MEWLDALDIAIDDFAARLALVTGDQWVAPTPCDEWDVHYLVAHVVGGNRFTSMVMAGVPSAEALEKVMAATHLGPDPCADFATSAEAMRTAFRTSGAMEQKADHPVGRIDGRQFLEFRVADIGLHAWDLAIAIGADDALASALVAVLLDGQAGGDSPQDALLALNGRRRG